MFFGGGTPTFLTNDELTLMMETLTKRFPLAQGGEFSIEVDPRTCDADKVKHLHDLGLNRMSLGVQDFNPDVQKAVNRIQPFEMTKATMEAARENGFESINMVLIYGLPKQNRGTFEKTIDQVLELSPDRIALYHYAHLPNHFKPQRRILPADLADRADCDRLCAELAGERINIFINNAGFGVCGSLLETDPAKEEEMVQVNVAAMRRLFQFMLRRMQAQGGGTILNVASSAGLLPGGPYMAGYYASKAYVVSLTRGAAQELREKRSPVYVCALCPGPVNTEFNDRAGVVFALKGITPEFCVDEAIHGMLHHKTIIVPSAFMRLCTSAQKLLPTPLLMPIVARQQKKKLG